MWPCPSARSQRPSTAGVRGSPLSSGPLREREWGEGVAALGASRRSAPWHFAWRAIGGRRDPPQTEPWPSLRVVVWFFVNGIRRSSSFASLYPPSPQPLIHLFLPLSPPPALRRFSSIPSGDVRAPRGAARKHLGRRLRAMRRTPRPSMECGGPYLGSCKVLPGFVLGRGRPSHYLGKAYQGPPSSPVPLRSTSRTSRCFSRALATTSASMRVRSRLRIACFLMRFRGARLPMLWRMRVLRRVALPHGGSSPATVSRPTCRSNLTSTSLRCGRRAPAAPWTA